MSLQTEKTLSDEAERRLSLADLAQEAIMVQDAVNLSGIVHGWSKAISELRLIMPTAGTQEINRHPINKMWASKVHDLTGMGLSDMDRFSEAYQWCKEHAK